MNAARNAAPSRLNGALVWMGWTYRDGTQFHFLECSNTLDNHLGGPGDIVRSRWHLSPSTQPIWRLSARSKYNVSNVPHTGPCAFRSQYGDKSKKWQLTNHTICDLSVHTAKHPNLLAPYTLCMKGGYYLSHP